LAREDGTGWVSPGKLDRHPAVFLFWDSECAPCLRELTQLSRLRRAFPQAVFVAVSLSGRDATRRVLSRIPLDASVVRAVAPQRPGGLLAGLGNSGGVLPFTAAFTPEGSACLQAPGPLTVEFLERAARTCSL